MKMTVQYDDKQLKKALEMYFDIRKNVEPQKEIKRRAKNVAMRLIRSYKEASPGVQKIAAAVDKLGGRVKIRQRIKASGKSKGEQVKMEKRARQNANNFTATGWFKSAETLGGKPKVSKKVVGPKRGKIQQKFGGGKSLVTMTNDQPAALVVDAKGDLVKQAIKDETKDILKYVEHKQLQAARRAGL